jgi:GNAT superfamily N-acetyltransferase
MQIRRAGPDDVTELIRLRQVMFDAMQLPRGDPAWESSCRALLERGLVDGTFVAFVADDPVSGLAACGVAMVAQRLPGPANVSGRHGYVQSMVTDVRFRRRGLAREIFVALMVWFTTEGIDVVDLHATPAGEALYRTFGFGPTHTPELRWTRPSRARAIC